ncbi:MAG TPA: AAA family ATPase [Bacteroidia bacterium]|jgi:exodeoxyribonuclease-5|nr:AAA family ATPase [Bacteroidia bacterium]
MTHLEFQDILRSNFPFETTTGQRTLLEKLAAFMLSRDDRNCFVMRGYAGTGKTTIVGALVKSLPALRGKCSLMAPTGRAAKVLSAYSGMQALTIHKKIYMHNSDGAGSGRFVRKENLHTNTLFIVDEASMISGLTQPEFMGGTSLLHDLIEYVYSGVNCRLILIGDVAQLPPIGLDISPALDPVFLKKEYYLNADGFELTDVVRQAQESGILHNATKIRDMINQEEFTFPRFDLKGFKDIVRLTGEDLEDALNASYSKYGAEGTIVLCRSNKRANLFNQQIRARIRWQESEISAGDFMMVVKNNYHWLPEKSSAGFIANGDIAEIQKVGKIEEMHGFRFADVRLRLIDYPDEKEIEAKILLDTILSESPSMSQADNKKLFESVYSEHGEIEDRRFRMQKVKKDPYFNALQVKFAYAVTCHKAQGGQWESVFVEQGYLTEEMINREFMRWLYTALTRATEKLYLVNFSKEFFDSVS